MIDNETKVAFRNKLNEKVANLIRSSIPVKINNTLILRRYGICSGRSKYEIYYLKIILDMKGVHFEDTMSFEASYDENMIEAFMHNCEFFDKTLADDFDDLVLKIVKRIIEMGGNLEEEIDRRLFT